MYGYNPFEKAIEDVAVSDLSVLRDVPEGWYVEYKQEIPNGRSIAKSLSAFANTYGGWLFYGVKESADGRRVAGGFPGILTTEVPAAEQAIRQAASALVSPPPTFETKILNGPDKALGIDADHSVIAIGVPVGNNAPYVHGSGVIYRRVADSSEPRPETDRHFLDLLWKRGDDTKKAFDKFVHKKVGLSEAEGHISTVRICFFPDPWKERQLTSKLEFDDFAGFMSSLDPADGGIPFDNIFTTDSGFIGRQIRNNNATGAVFSWRYDYNCSSEILLPLNSVWVNEVRDMGQFLEGYEFREAFMRKSSSDNLRGFHLVDISQLYAVLYSIMRRKKALLAREGLRWRLFYKIQLSNFWRRVPFVDLKEVVSFMVQHGIPVVQDNTSYVPPGKGPNSCKEIKPYNRPEFNEEAELQIDATVLFLTLCSALGLPATAFGMAGQKEEEEEGEDLSMTRLLLLGERAQKVTMGRGKSR
ncbi:AlbA family DNA-binding domain-containing protein [Mesorhizobium ciceri]|uniref:AAA-4 family protein n=1 Tax=Mesorhizobium ciceri biovar biserrulae (strain HAMBI 2942 / LMG 23838 / WSM1271) TaxID=765698 RepID=E8T8S4_MESCW|nr:ATP-binding protein [Mesorhizobium ciceri]ADV12972.1 AAA-4 family protein [Mesorhizobium ciceri biovar biserrulae WSM1271]